MISQLGYLTGEQGWGLFEPLLGQGLVCLEGQPAWALEWEQIGVLSLGWAEGSARAEEPGLEPVQGAVLSEGLYSGQALGFVLPEEPGLAQGESVLPGGLGPWLVGELEGWRAAIWVDLGLGWGQGLCTVWDCMSGRTGWLRAATLAHQGAE